MWQGEECEQKKLHALLGRQNKIHVLLLLVLQGKVAESIKRNGDVELGGIRA